MKKLKLELDELVVESFTTGGHGSSGTVKANEDTVESQGTVGTCCGCGSLYCLDTDPNNGGGGGSGVFCQPTVAGTCHGSTCEGTCLNGCHDVSREFPNVCGVISYPNCSARCTNIVGCTTPDMGC